MGTLHLQIHHWEGGWIDCATCTFRGETIQLEYDVDYAATWLQRKDLMALSITYPVALSPFEGPVPGFLTDLIPQGVALHRILRRHGIDRESDVEAILGKVPLASPGNIRFKEPWQTIELARPTYQHRGFSREEVVESKFDFITYMEAHGAPVGGTSGAAGGAPKFLLREDGDGRFHADGYLDDNLTKRAWLIKFPFTDSNMSRQLVQTEKAYYDVLRQMPLKTGAALAIDRDILFIPRFDRVRRPDGRLHYLGLESFYAAHGILGHGAHLKHEQNLSLIHRISTNPQTDIIEYWKRDIVYQALANTDNHGRNTSFIKEENQITLSPIYDVTAMRFFEGDLIVPLTRWESAHEGSRAQMQWISAAFAIPPAKLKQELAKLKVHLLSLETRLLAAGTPPTIVKNTKTDRQRVIDDLEWVD